MRKGQEIILQNANKADMVEDEISVLSREDLTLNELKIMFDYFWHQDGISGELLAAEAERCLSMLQFIKEKSGNKQYLFLLQSLLPSYWSIEKDTILGSRKKYFLLKAYFYIQTLKKNYAIQDDYLFIAYRNMLYSGMSSWCINTVLRELLRDKNKRENIFYLCFPANSPELADDFIYNKEKSLFYYIAIKNDIVCKIHLSNYAGLLRNIYDYNKHLFCSPQEDYDKIFISMQDETNEVVQYKINMDYITLRSIEKYPIVKQIVSFAEERKSSFDKVDNFCYRSWWLDRPEVEEKVQQCNEILDVNFTINTKAYYFGIQINKENCFINISFKIYSSIIAGTNNKNGWITGKQVGDRSFVIAPDGRLFKKYAAGRKLFPLSVKEFCSLYMEQNICGDLVSVIKSYLEKENYFYKDIFHDMMKCQCMIPLNINEIMQYHNRAELIRGKYKSAEKIQIKWNKQNINLSYLIVKAYSCVDSEKSRQILIQERDVSIIENGMYSTKARYKPYDFLVQILHRKIASYEMKRKSADIAAIHEKYQNEITEELQTDILPDEYEQWMKEKMDDGNDSLLSTIRDYVEMCRQTKKKIRLDIYSEKELCNLHNRVTTNETDYRKKTGEVSIPNKSKFLHLREILPDNFEWITTRKRLILETELQHHYVWSYAEKITKDECAIYSFVDINAEHCKDGVPKRYTIEFGQKQDKSYYVVRVQGKYDRINANQMCEYVQALLIEYENVKNSSEQTIA